MRNTNDPMADLLSRYAEAAANRLVERLDAPGECSIPYSQCANCMHHQTCGVEAVRFVFYDEVQSMMAESKTEQ